MADINNSTPPKLNVVGVALNDNFKKYVLWTLKLIKDSPSIFNKVSYYNEKALAKASDMSHYDIVITDSQSKIDKSKLKSNAIIGYIRGTLLFE